MTLLAIYLIGILIAIISRVIVLTNPLMPKDERYFDTVSSIVEWIVLVVFWPIVLLMILIAGSLYLIGKLMGL